MLRMQGGEERRGTREQVQWTCESDERRELGQAAGMADLDCFARDLARYFTWVVIGLSLSLITIARKRAFSVVLALAETVWMSVGLS